MSNQNIYYRNWRTIGLTTTAIILSIILSVVSFLIISPLTYPAPVKAFTPELVVAGNNTSQVITADGNRYIQGLNNNSQLGSGTNEYSLFDWKQVSNENPTESFTKLSGSGSHTLGYTENNTIWGWGNNNNGQMGTPDANPVQSPIQFKVPRPYQTITTGKNHVLAINMTGNLVVWGQNSAGQLGTGDKTVHADPTIINPTVKFKSVFAIENMSYAVDVENNVYAWGQNDQGQLGLGNRNETLTPTQIPNLKISKIVSNGTTTIALNLDGSLTAWGNNSQGLLGNGTDWRRLQQEENDRVAQQIEEIRAQDTARKNALILQCEQSRQASAAAAANSSATFNEPAPVPEQTPAPTPTPPLPTPTPSPTPPPAPPAPTISCEDEVNATFVPTDTSSIKPAIITAPPLQPDSGVPVPVNSSEKFVDVSVGSENVFAISINGRLYGWGVDKNGQSCLNINEDTVTQTPVPCAVTDGFTHVSAGVKVAGAVKHDGSLMLWGDGSTNGLTLQQPVLPTITQVASSVANIKISGNTGYYLDNSGMVYGWGVLTDGLSGTGESFDKAQSFVPTNLALNDLSITDTTGLGLDHNNHLMVWGKNSNSTFGYGSINDNVVPAQKIIIEKFIDMAASESVSALVDEAGIVWMYGINVWGQIGPYAVNGAPYSPAPVIIPVEVRKVAVNLRSVYAVGVDNSIWTWGATNPTPRLVGTHDKTITELTASLDAVQFLDSNGEVWESSESEINESHAVTNSVFRKVSLNTKATHIAAGGLGAVAIAENGYLYGWGGAAYITTPINSEKEPTTDDDTSKPVLLDDTHKYVKVSVSQTHFLALTEDNVLMGAGSSIYGALGSTGYLLFNLTPLSTVVKETLK